MKVLVRLILLVVVGPIMATPVEAQLFRKKPTTPPLPAAQRVPELVLILKTDGDERQRIQAAAELRDFDIRAYTEIVPVLIEAALTDAQVSVRIEALTSLGKIRPVSQEAGQALDKAAASDDNLRVRVHARTTLWKYQLAGYSANMAKTDAKRLATDEPPLIDSPAPVLGPPEDLPVAPAGKGPAKKTPAADPVTPPRPLPTGPGFSTAVPMRPRVVSPSPEPTIIEDDLPLPPSPLPTAPPLPALPPLPK